MPRRLVKPLGVVLVVAAFAYLFVYRVGWQELVATLSSFDPRWSLLVLLGQIGFHLLGGVALWVLALSLRRIALGALLRAYWRALAVGYWTPATVGEVSFAWLVGPAGIPVREGLALVTVDKLVTLAVTGLLALPALWFGLPLLALRLQLPAAAAGIALALVLVAFGGFVWLRPSSRGARLTLVVVEYLRLLDQVGLRSRGPLLANVLLTLVRTVAAAAVFWWAIAGFDQDLDVSFGRFVVLVSLARLLALVVPTPNGLGVFEVALVELLGHTEGVAPAVLAGALVARLAALLVVTAGLLLGTVQEPVPTASEEQP